MNYESDSSGHSRRTNVGYHFFVAAAAILILGTVAWPTESAFQVRALVRLVNERALPTGSRGRPLFSDEDLANAWQRVSGAAVDEAAGRRLRSRLRVDTRQRPDTSGLEVRLVMINTRSPLSVKWVDQLSQMLSMRANQAALQHRARISREKWLGELNAAADEERMLRKSLDALVESRIVSGIAAATLGGDASEPHRTLNPVWVEKTRRARLAREAINDDLETLTDRHPLVREKIAKLRRLEGELIATPKSLPIAQHATEESLTAAGVSQLSPKRDRLVSLNQPTSSSGAWDDALQQQYRRLRDRCCEAADRRAALESRLSRAGSSADAGNAAWIESRAAVVGSAGKFDVRALMLLLTAIVGGASLAALGVCIATNEFPTMLAGWQRPIYLGALGAAEVVVGGFIVIQIALIATGKSPADAQALFQQLVTGPWA